MMMNCLWFVVYGLLLFKGWLAIYFEPQSAAATTNYKQQTTNNKLPRHFYTRNYLLDHIIRRSPLHFLLRR
jgi:hypothetical protein